MQGAEGIELWVDLIREKHRDAERREEAPSPCIFMAPSPLRDRNIEAFVPQVVAIGPLQYSDLGPHHSSFPENQEAQRHTKKIPAEEMEQHKVMASHYLSKSLAERGSSDLIDDISQDIRLVRTCYDNGLTGTSDETLACSLGLDVSFVVEVLRFFASNRTILPGSGGFAVYFCERLARPLRTPILQEFALLENQIPLFLLLKAVRMDQTCATDEDALQILADLVSKLAQEVLPFSISTSGGSTVNSAAGLNLKEKKHLLDCLYEIVTHERGDNGSSAPAASEPLLIESKPTPFPSASELHSYGVRIRPVPGGNMTSIRFDKATHTLCVPNVRVGDGTKRLLWNLIAYESRLADNVRVLSYLQFMHGLVKTADDVALLVDKGIITHDKGSCNEEVVQMWTDLGVSTTREWSREYECVALQLVQYRSSKENAWMPKLKRTCVCPRLWAIVCHLCRWGALCLFVLFVCFVFLFIFLGGRYIIADIFSDPFKDFPKPFKWR